MSIQTAKPHYRVVDGAWRQTSANTGAVPHFRLRDGQMQMVRPAGSPEMTEEQVRLLIKRHWGQYKLFGEAFGFDCQTVVAAVRPWGHQSAGKKRAIRLLLGMASQPSDKACFVAVQKSSAAAKGCAA